MKSRRAHCSEKGNPDLDNSLFQTQDPSFIWGVPLVPELDKAAYLLATEFRCSNLAWLLEGWTHFS